MKISVKTVPLSLRTWFIVHFLADMLFGLPLFFFPLWTLQMLGASTVDIFSARLIAAALLAIGGVSLIIRNKGRETYDSLLTLKIIWATTAIIGMSISLLQGYGPASGWMMVAFFAIFLTSWIYYKHRLHSI